MWRWAVLALLVGCTAGEKLTGPSPRILSIDFRGIMWSNSRIPYEVTFKHVKFIQIEFQELIFFAGRMRWQSLGRTPQYNVSNTEKLESWFNSDRAGKYLIMVRVWGIYGGYKSQTKRFAVW